MIEGGVRPITQDSTGATRAEKISKTDAKIIWTRPATSVSQQIRAFTSSPGAWCDFRDTTVKILKAIDSSKKYAPGELAAHEGRLYVGTATTALEVLTLQPAGRAQISAAAWLNGVRLQSGDFFG